MRLILLSLTACVFCGGCSFVSEQERSARFCLGIGRLIEHGIPHRQAPRTYGPKQLPRVTQAVYIEVE